METPVEILSHHASIDAAKGFVEWRRLLKKPLTSRAAGMIAKTLREIAECGGDADEALDLAAEHGWQTIKADWYWNLKQQAEPQLKAINGGYNAKTSKPHSQTDLIALAARVRTSPR